MAPMTTRCIPGFEAVPLVAACRAASGAAFLATASSRRCSLRASSRFCRLDGIIRPPPAERKSVGRAPRSQQRYDLSRVACKTCVRVGSLAHASRSGPEAAHLYAMNSCLTSRFRCHELGRGCFDLQATQEAAGGMRCSVWTPRLAHAQLIQPPKPSRQEQYCATTSWPQQSVQVANWDTWHPHFLAPQGSAR